MQAIYAFALLIFFAVLGARFFSQGGRSFSNFRFFFYSGLFYIFLGLILGSSGLNILNEKVLKALSPIMALGLGWIGFVFGFQFERRYLKRFSLKYYYLSFFLFILTFFAGTVIMWLLLHTFYPGQPAFLIGGMAVSFGLLLTLHSPTILNAMTPFVPCQNKYFYLARFLVSIGSVWGICGLAVVVSFWRYPYSSERMLVKGVLILLTATLFSGLMGYLFHLMTRRRPTEKDLLVYILGTVFFVSGTAFYFNLIPLFACMVLGIFYSNLTRKHGKIYSLLLSTEKPLFIVFLILIGAFWELNFTWQVAALVLVMLVLEILLHTLPMPVLGKALKFPLHLPHIFGNCLLSSGGIGVAFAVSLKLTYPVPLIDIFLSISLLMIILSELISPWAIKAALYRLEKRT